jgi:hypothetical protein
MLPDTAAQQQRVIPIPHPLIGAINPNRATYATFLEARLSLIAPL